VLLNELGLDPGIDHITAMRLIFEAKETGNKVGAQLLRKNAELTRRSADQVVRLILRRLARA
jgi:hypothetical protein